MALLRFRVSNFRSIAGEQELSLVAIDEHEGVFAAGGRPTVPAVGVYGANASGKSALLEALRYATLAVRQSHRSWGPDDGTGRQAHAFGQRELDSSTFEFEFVAGRSTYAYGFEVDDWEVISESLVQRTTTKPRVLFERNRDEFSFSRTFHGPKSTVRRVTRPNSLFLSAAAQLRYVELEPVYAFFADVTFRNVARRPSRLPLSADERTIARSILQDNQHSSNLRRMLKLADFGIGDITVSEAEENSPQVYFEHTGEADDHATLAYEDESHGTRQWLLLANAALRSLQAGGVIVIDEIDRSLHPHLTAELLRMFQDPQTNTRQSQLVFTSHDVTLLRSDNPWSLRRDQLWFTEKTAGVTRLYAASDFARSSSRQDLGSLYITGRMGGVPVVDYSQLARLALQSALPRRALAGQLSLPSMNESADTGDDN